MTYTHAATPRIYLIVWGWLAGLMLLSVLLSRFPISASTVVSVVFILSAIKACLVALYYMHLKFDRRWLVVIALFPLVVIALAAGVVLSSHLVKL